MGKFITSFEDNNSYQQAIFDENNTPNISLCKQENEVYFTPYIPPQPKFLDILYSDSSGNLTFTSEVLGNSLGKTPIALCIAPTGFFGKNEPARWMSLKYMSYTTPEVGSLNGEEGIMYGNNNADIPTIDNIQTLYENGPSFGYINADWVTQTYNQVPKLITENNKWNISVLGSVNQYAMTDIDGKNKTIKMINTVTGQSTWQTDTSIINNKSAGYAPAACCCSRYYTLGTKAGDWYLGACGEFAIIIQKKTEIVSKLVMINSSYPNNCISSLRTNDYYTATEYNSGYAYTISPGNGYINYSGKGYYELIIAMLQY